jgi:hypothetical protein
LSPTQAAGNDCQRPGQRRKADQNLLHLLGVLLLTDDALMSRKATRDARDSQAGRTTAYQAEHNTSRDMKETESAICAI